MSISASFELINGTQEAPGQLLFDPVLFNQNAFLQQKDYRQLKTFLARTKKNEVVARLRLAQDSDGTEWVSLPGAPYGGLEFRVDYDPTYFLKFVKDHFGSAEKVLIKDRPNYGTASIDYFMNAGFALSGIELNHHVNLDQPIEIHPMEQRRLKKATEVGCKMNEIVLNVENTQLLHSFIDRCRKQQGLRINISEDNLLNTVVSLPTYYTGFGVYLDKVIIAATILVHVSGTVVYHYLPASDKDYHHLSPMVLLMSELYKLLVDKGLRILDLGQTSIQGEEQVSLARFKEAMGAKRSEKRIYSL